jgi:ubiquinone/menaquinone biosynthesis C-methylase UbiE
MIDAVSLSATDIEHEFDVTASRYDLMVSLNPGYHDHLRSAATLLADSLPRDRPLTLLDLGCGSGASTEALVSRLDAHGDVDVVGVDASAGMIAETRGKTWPAGVRFAHGRAEQLAEPPADWGLPAQLDGVFACYLFRNLAERDRDTVLADVYRRLAPGGCLVVQEYSVAGSRRAALLWSIVCWLVVIPLSLVLTRRTILYRYLWRSVLRFDPVATFSARLVAAGFAPTAVTSVDGWQHGILHTFVAHKPA